MKNGSGNIFNYGESKNENISFVENITWDFLKKNKWRGLNRTYKRKKTCKR